MNEEDRNEDNPPAPSPISTVSFEIAKSSAGTDIPLEKTLLIIKPDVMERFPEIEDIVLNQGFTILQRRYVQLTPEQVFDLYADQKGKIHFQTLLMFMGSAPVQVLVLARVNAVQLMLELAGPEDSEKAREIAPTSIRAQFGTDELRNAIHTSESVAAARREIQLVFPDNIVSQLPKTNEAKDYIKHLLNPTLLKGLTQLCKEKPENPRLWLANWLIQNNPYRPNIMEPTVTFRSV